LEPHQLVDLKALQGDSSDNIPGIKGVGVKTATPLIQKYGSLADIYAHLDEVKGSARKKLDKGRNMAFVSYELARVRTDLPMQLDLAACVTREYETSDAIDLFEQLDFRSLIRRLLKAEDEEPAPPTQTSMFDMGEVDVAAGEFEDTGEFAAAVHAADLVESAAVVSEDGLQKVVEMLNSASIISFDTETTGIDPVAADLVGISLAVNGDTGYYIPLTHIDTEVEQLPIETVIEALRGPLTNPDIPKVAHNASYDLVVLRRYGLDVTPIAFDTMIAEWVRDSASNDLGLGNLAMRQGLLTERGVLMQSITELIGKGKNQRTFDTVPLTKATPYAAEDAAITMKLVKPLQKNLQTYEAAVKLFQNTEMPLVPVIATMEQTGVLLDRDFLGEMSTRLDSLLLDLERSVREIAGKDELNLNSPKQLSELLFDDLDLPKKGIRKTKLGYSTAADILERLYEDTKHPILQKILEYRELAKLKGTYVDALPELINPETGRLHTSFNQTGTTTGRLSSSNPNLQ
ncbi:MAG: DNA polymerase, partial [Chloroflexota bacterium]